MGFLQAPDAVVMVRPHRFHSNPETASDNSFQVVEGSSAEQTAAAALEEFGTTVEKLRLAGISVHVFDDYGEQDTPDSVFPNNWFSTHAGGHIAIFPMFTENRRRERRWDIIEMLKSKYRVQDVIDYSGLEQDGLALEGTGAMVLDHIARIAYTAQSNRADPVILERFCTNFNFEPMTFLATDKLGKPVYHTNVMMTIGTDLAIVASEMISDEQRRQEVLARLQESGRQIIEITRDQVTEFAGNAIELSANGKRTLVISARALASLSPDQRTQIEALIDTLSVDIPTIETAGGSIRCMIAGIHLAKR
ncbi:MAG: arginine deiminase-related protein [Pseudomonadota bacterium]